MIIFRWILLRMKSVAEKFWKNNHNPYFILNKFCSKWRLLWYNVINKQVRSRQTAGSKVIWRMRVACRISKSGIRTQTAWGKDGQWCPTVCSDVFVQFRVATAVTCGCVAGMAGSVLQTVCLSVSFVATAVTRGCVAGMAGSVLQTVCLSVCFFCSKFKFNLSLNKNLK